MSNRPDDPFAGLLLPQTNSTSVRSLQTTSSLTAPSSTIPSTDNNSSVRSRLSAVFSADPTFSAADTSNEVFLVRSGENGSDPANSGPSLDSLGGALPESPFNPMPRRRPLMAAPRQYPITPFPAQDRSQNGIQEGAEGVGGGRGCCSGSESGSLSERILSGVHSQPPRPPRQQAPPPQIDSPPSQHRNASIFSSGQSTALPSFPVFSDLTPSPFDAPPPPPPPPLPERNQPPQTHLDDGFVAPASQLQHSRHHHRGTEAEDGQPLAPSDEVDPFSPVASSSIPPLTRPSTDGAMPPPPPPTSSSSSAAAAAAAAATATPYAHPQAVSWEAGSASELVVLRRTLSVTRQQLLAEQVRAASLEERNLERNLGGNLALRAPRQGEGRGALESGGGGSGTTEAVVEEEEGEEGEEEGAGGGGLPSWWHAPSSSSSSSSSSPPPPSARPNWRCPVCTLVNDEDLGRCGACDTRQPARQPTTTPPPLLPPRQQQPTTENLGVVLLDDHLGGASELSTELPPPPPPPPPPTSSSSLPHSNFPLTADAPDNDRGSPFVAGGSLVGHGGSSATSTGVDTGTTDPYNASFDSISGLWVFPETAFDPFVPPSPSSPSPPPLPPRRVRFRPPRNATLRRPSREQPPSNSASGSTATAVGGSAFTRAPAAEPAERAEEAEGDEAAKGGGGCGGESGERDGGFGSEGAVSADCVVCMDSARDAIIVHGRDAHHVCCLECANALRVCPVCQRPIEAVLRYFS